jgi:hypothetical protein
MLSKKYFMHSLSFQNMHTEFPHRLDFPYPKAQAQKSPQCRSAGNSNKTSQYVSEVSIFRIHLKSFDA